MHDDLVLDMEDEERKVVNEFCHLLEKSKQLFNGLRDMPQVQYITSTRISLVFSCQLFAHCFYIC